MHQIGVGVLGPVFRTYEPDEDRLVAVKAFHLDITPEQNRTLVDALERLVGAGLSHPGLVTPIAAGLQDDVPYLAQEFVTVESLDVGMRHYAPASPETALSFIRRIGEAIDAAHLQGVVHGGLHLRDIFVTPDEARVTGFGVVRALEELRLAGPIRRPYTAPEVIGGRAWGGEADVFALAAVGYELLTGRRAAGTGEQVIARLRSLKGVADTEALRAVFATALADGPDDRFSSASGFVSALEAAVGQPGDERARDSDDRDAGMSASAAPPVDLLAGLDIRADATTPLEFPAESDRIVAADSATDDPADSALETEGPAGMGDGIAFKPDQRGKEAFDFEEALGESSPKAPEQLDEPDDRAGEQDAVFVDEGVDRNAGADANDDSGDDLRYDDDLDDDELELEEDAEFEEDAEEEAADGEHQQAGARGPDTADDSDPDESGDRDTDLGPDKAGPADWDDPEDNDFHLEPEVTPSAAPPGQADDEPFAAWEPAERESSGHVTGDDLFDDDDDEDDSLGQTDARSESERYERDHTNRVLPPEAYELPYDDRPVWARRPALLLLLAVVMVGGFAYFIGGALSPDTGRPAASDTADVPVPDVLAADPRAARQNARSTATEDDTAGDPEAGAVIDPGGVSDPEVDPAAPGSRLAAVDTASTAPPDEADPAGRAAEAAPGASIPTGTAATAASRPLPAPATVDQDAVAPVPASVPASSRAVPLSSADTNPSQGDSGWLLVRTVPVAATVEVDGVNRGTTPLSISDIAFGEHEVVVSHVGYATMTQMVTFGPANTVVSLGVDLEPGVDRAAEIEPAPPAGPDPGGPVAGVTVESRPPGARITVDGAPLGVTPLLVSLAFGPHAIRLELEGYEPWMREVTVTASESIRIAASLERSTR